MKDVEKMALLKLAKYVSIIKSVKAIEINSSVVVSSYTKVFLHSIIAGSMNS